MTLQELQTLATTHLGEQLERADRATLADFLASLQTLLPGTQQGEVFRVEGAAGSYEEAMRSYFADMLHAPADRAAASLWITAAEMWLDSMDGG